MGQGADSCGAYEDEYDPYAEGLAMGDWTTRDGESINVSRMTQQHLRGARRIAARAAAVASFSSDADMWQSWVDIFDREMARRPAEPRKDVKPKAEKKGTLIKMVCHCGTQYDAREAELKRGWGLSCSKGCAAVRREFGRPAAKRLK